MGIKVGYFRIAPENHSLISYCRTTWCRCGYVIDSSILDDEQHVTNHDYSYETVPRYAFTQIENTSTRY